MTTPDTDTAGRLVTDVAGLLDHAGRDLGRTEWREMDQPGWCPSHPPVKLRF